MTTRRRGSWAASFLLAVALFAVAAASASAAKPEFGNEIYPRPFTIKSNVLDVQTSEGAYDCEHLSGEGSITGHKSGTVTFKATGCNALPRYCHTGPKNNEMAMLPMTLTPVYTPGKKVALEFKPASGEAIANLTGILRPCVLKGSILGSFEMFRETEGVVRFSQSNGNQFLTQYENEKGELVNSWPELGWATGAPSWVKEGWETTATITIPLGIQLKS